MKWSAVTVNLSKVRKTGQMLGVYSKTLSMLMIGCFIFFMVLGVLGYVQSRVSGASPNASMKGLAASVSSRFFLWI